MKDFEEIIKSPQVEIRMCTSNMLSGFITLAYMRKSNRLVFIAGRNEDGLEHVSVSYKNRVPSWDEMSAVKDLLFEPEEEVYEIHAKKSEYVNLHPYCLHMWRPVNGKVIKDLTK